MVKKCFPNDSKYLFSFKCRHVLCCVKDHEELGKHSDWDFTTRTPWTWGDHLWDGACCSFRTKIFKKGLWASGQQGRNRHREQTCGRGRRERVTWKRTGPCVKQIEWERAVRLGELRLQAGVEETEGGPGGRGRGCACGWFLLRSDRTRQNPVNQLSSNLKKIF